jgi:ribosomal protein S18 acetylase RimI-like enzyme
MRLRRATVEDIAAMQRVETAANQRFRGHSEPRIAARADADPYPSDALERVIGDRRAWVALDESETIVGFSVGWTFDGEAHLDEVAVVPEHGRRGIGRALIDEVVAWAVAQDLTSMTLTTFRDVPWNAPYYERLGFRVVNDLTPALQRMLDHQATYGFAPELRVVMRRSLQNLDRS